MQMCISVSCPCSFAEDILLVQSIKPRLFMALLYFNLYVAVSTLCEFDETFYCIEKVT